MHPLNRAIVRPSADGPRQEKLLLSGRRADHGRPSEKETSGEQASCGKSRTGGEYQVALRPQDGAEGLEAQEAWRDLQESHQGALGYYKLLASLMA